MYRIIISRVAEKQLATFPKHIANNITARIDSLAENPRPTGCKKLEGGDKEYRTQNPDRRLPNSLQN